MTGWRIYYDDGSTFDSSQGAPGAAPPWGVLCVVQPDPTVGRAVICAPDKGFFVWADAHGEWDAKDYTGLVDFLAHFPGCVVRFGRSAPNVVFQAVHRRAVTDPDFPRQSAT